MKKLSILLLVLVVFGACDENTWVDSSGPATTADPAATTTTTTAEPTTTADPAATTTTTTAEPTTTTVTKGPGGSASYTYDLIPMENYDDYPLIPSLRDMGIQLVLAESLKNGHITSTEVVLQTTNSVERRLGSNNNEFYRFNCSLANGNNKTQTVMAFFVARHNTVTLVDAVPYWYYLAHMFWVANPTTSVVETDQTPPEPEPEPEPVEEEEEEEEEAAPPVTTPVTSTSTDTILYPWILQPAADYGSEFHVDNANYGMNYFVSQEVTKGNITNGTYSIKLIDEIWKQVLPNVTNYRYITQVDKAEDNYTYNVTFGIRFLNSNNARSMGFYRFQMLDANGNAIGKGALPDLEPVKNASQTVTTTTVDGNPVSTTTGGITVDP